ncbi:sulfotransferase family protein [Muriicola soli]|uniref:Sulfotransferase n=1 Tax=Muriicola soli TaxID=2507538 RepID=A0A411ECC5_9FLAO|nr:sulfotransferase [Muriicola soli]QBA65406.1 sulfotransferase [Muriicola soli]
MRDIYIVGVGRSGTSLLQSMLHAHSELTSSPESHFFRSYIASEKRQKKMELRGPENFKEVLRKDRFFNRLEVDPDQLKTLSGSSFTILDVNKEITDLLKEKYGKEVLVDKDPRNLENISKIHNYFQDARIVHIIRDPRDVVYSKTKANWSSRRPYWLHAMIGEAQMKKGLASASKLDSTTYHQLKYEDLLEFPEEVLQKLCLFLDLTYEQGMLNFNEKAKELVTKDEMQWKKETLQPLKKGNRFKWKEFYSPFQLAVIEKISQDSMTAFGYKNLADRSKLNIWLRMNISLANYASILFSPAYLVLKKWI